jgi:23S rRNA-/tRNA-specific pseudouridylate synthase
VGCSVAEYLSKQCTYIGTKNRVHKVCRSGKVLLNDVKVYSSTKLILNDVITIDKKGILEELKVTNTLNDIDLARLVSYTNSLLSTNQNPPFHILYEDNLMSVVFKPPGVHSMKWTGTMKRRLFALGNYHFFYNYNLKIINVFFIR